MNISPDSRLYQYLATLLSYVCLNILFLLLCVPVITALPAYAALYSVSLREAEGDYGYIFRTFFRAMGRKYFLRSLAVGLVYAAVAAVLLFGTVFWYNVGTDILTGIVTVLLAALLGAVLAAMDYALAGLVRYDLTVKEALKKGLQLVSLHRGYAAAILAIDVLIVYLCTYQGFRIFMVLIGASFSVYCKSWIMLHVFGKYEKEATDTGDIAEEADAESDAAEQDGPLGKDKH